MCIGKSVHMYTCLCMVVCVYFCICVYACEPVYIFLQRNKTYSFICKNKIDFDMFFPMSEVRSYFHLIRLRKESKIIFLSHPAC